MRGFTSAVSCIVLVQLLTACGTPEVFTKAPTSQKDTGFIIQGNEEDTQKVLAASQSYRVISAKHHNYEVKGLTYHEIKKISPSLSVEKNQYIESALDGKIGLTLSNADYLHPKSFDGNNGANQIPAELQTCQKIQEDDSPELAITLKTAVLSESITMNLGETVHFSGEESKSNTTNSSQLQFRWKVLPPGLSSMETQVYSQETLKVTPDSVGLYRLVFVAEDVNMNCNFQVIGFLVTHNPGVQFATDDEVRPTVDLNAFAHLKKVQAAEAWETSNGTGITVAVLDTGLHYNHKAIKFNLAINENEKNGKLDSDDDNNDFKDDVIGWDFVNGDNMPFDDEGHGSHVSGILASHIYGLARNARVLPVKVLNAAGGSDTASVIAGIYYAVDNGAQVINGSIGGFKDKLEALKTAIEYAQSKGVVIVTAAGNSELDLSDPNTIDIFPGEFDTESLINVVATGVNDKLTSYSNFGKVETDVAAPGGDEVVPIYSLATLNSHDAIFIGSSGTSMAAPIVAGIAALMLAINPELTNLQVKELLMQSGKNVPALASGVGSGKLISALDAVSLAEQSLQRTPH